METENEQAEIPVRQRLASGPYPHRMITFTGIVFLSVLTVFYFAGVLGTNWLTEVGQQYNAGPEGQAEHYGLAMFLAFLLHLTGLVGMIVIRFRRKAGFFIVALSLLIMIALIISGILIMVLSPVYYLILIILAALLYPGLR
jgi:hypothetical protein